MSTQPTLYFDAEDVREHVAKSRDCRHGYGFTYDFCPIVHRVNSYEANQREIKALRAIITAYDHAAAAIEGDSK